MTDGKNPTEKTKQIEVETNGKGDLEDVEIQSDIDLSDPKYYINRELSMLEFQKRVYEEATDPKNPLLERIKFMAIVANNLDEFFMVRVGGLKLQLSAGVVDLPPDGLTPAEQLAAIRKEAFNLLTEMRTYYLQVLKPALDENGVHLLNYDQLNERQQASVQSYFEEMIFPVLTPLAFDPGHPFPHISNLSLNLAVMIRDKEGRRRFARVKVPGTLPRLVPIKRSSGGTKKDGTVPYNHYFIWLEQVIAANLDSLFPGMEVQEVHPFRVTRNADMIIQELEADDLLETMEESVRQRRFGEVVRLAVNPDMPEPIQQILLENLLVDRRDLYLLEGPLGFGQLIELHVDIDRFDLFDSPYVPSLPPVIRDKPDESIFNLIQRGNFLVHLPYDSFSPVINFLKTAALDPNVLAIKQTLYRAGKNSPVVEALLKARQNGKQVAVLVELKARFDEESNIGWARRLEQEGVHVTYGLLGLKTHSKIALVVRKEDDHIRRYVHLSTGNYNAVTAHVYEDIGMFTIDPDIGADATDLFNSLTGYSTKDNYRKLLVAPTSLRDRIADLITREIVHQKEGRKAHIIFKVNHIVDKKMITLLYEASQAGVKIDLYVRGMCSLRPGIPGVSENIQVTSIVGRFLEHSRIYYFLNDGAEEIFMGSADLMPRNLNRRVEVVFPVEDPPLIRHIRGEILETYLHDNIRARKMNPDGTYTRVSPPEGQKGVDTQLRLLKMRG